MLRAEQMARNIRRLAKILKRNRLIADKSLWVLNDAAAYVQANPPENWELVISPENPLEFMKAQSDDRLKPDIFCETKVGSKNGWPILHSSLVLRVWSVKPSVSYRATWDSGDLKETFESIGSYKRVIFRCHYDNCNEGQYAPIFHLQFGGKPNTSEYFWFPHYLELPRFTSPPMDLILACEFVVAAFFQSTYMRLRHDNVWRSIIKDSECFLMRRYYGACKNYFDGMYKDETFLDHLCSMRTRV